VNVLTDISFDSGKWILEYQRDTRGNLLGPLQICQDLSEKLQSRKGGPTNVSHLCCSVARYVTHLSENYLNHQQTQLIPLSSSDLPFLTSSSSMIQLRNIRVIFTLSILVHKINIPYERQAHEQKPK
jgi:hypothetical protein